MTSGIKNLSRGVGTKHIFSKQPQQWRDSQLTKPQVVQVFLNLGSSFDCCLYSNEGVAAAVVVAGASHLVVDILRPTSDANDAAVFMAPVPAAVAARNGNVSRLVRGSLIQYWCSWSGFGCCRC